MIRAYVVDDEELALRRLVRLIEETRRVEIAGRSTDPEEALAFLRSHDVDVLFLDIQMPGMTGFDLLANLDRQPAVVFTTAFDRYALRAFEVNSIDYLLKPIEQAQLERALAKVDRMKGAGHGISRELMEQLAASLREQRPQYPERISSRVGDRVQFIELLRVTHFFAEEKLTYAATQARNYVVDSTISQLEERLNPRQFCRIHRSTLVNLAYVAEADSLSVRLKDEKGTALPVARDRLRNLRARMGY